MDCIWKDKSARPCVCIACGRPCRVPAFKTCTGPPGLGTYIARVLSLIGITQTRWGKWMYHFGFAAKPVCGCPKKQQELDAWSHTSPAAKPAMYWLGNFRNNLSALKRLFKKA